MRILVIYCHPNPQSFTAAVRDAALRALRANNHDLRVLDLYAEGFNPAMGCEERLNYHTPGVNAQPVADHIAHLRWAEGLLFVYPTWWYGQPAMLKGWLDRVWIPHVTFSMPTDNDPIRGLLPHVRLVGAITTLGSPGWWWLYMGQPGRRVLLRGLRALCAKDCKTLWLALHKIDGATQAHREQFLAKIERRLAKITA